MWQNLIAIIIVVLCGVAALRMLLRTIKGTSSKCGCDKPCSSKQVQIEKHTP